MIKVIERLRSECILNAEEDSGFSRDILWLCNEAEDMSSEIERLEGELVKWRASDDAHREQAEMWKTAFYHGKQRVEELERSISQLQQVNLANSELIEQLETATRRAQELMNQSRYHAAEIELRSILLEDRE